MYIHFLMCIATVCGLDCIIKQTSYVYVYAITLLFLYMRLDLQKLTKLSQELKSKLKF